MQNIQCGNKEPNNRTRFHKMKKRFLTKRDGYGKAKRKEGDGQMWYKGRLEIQERFAE